MKTTVRTLAAIAILIAILIASFAAPANAQHPAMPPGMTHEQHLEQLKKDAELKKRGAEAMGFDQDKTTHHFRLSSSGGAIEVSINDPADGAGRDQVRRHLEEIAAEFTTGAFDKPFATHGEVPPGVGAMQQRKNAIVYAYEDTPDGGRVRIDTSDTQARSAVHEFLRYQIREHKTGDPLTVAKD
jgi:hypothetical protein